MVHVDESFHQRLGPLHVVPGGARITCLDVLGDTGRIAVHVSYSSVDFDGSISEKQLMEETVPVPQ
jgi:hypothetical protein